MYWGGVTYSRQPELALHSQFTPRNVKPKKEVHLEIAGLLGTLERFLILADLSLNAEGAETQSTAEQK